MATLRNIIVSNRFEKIHSSLGIIVAELLTGLSSNQVAWSCVSSAQGLACNMGWGQSQPCWFKYFQNVSPIETHILD